MKCSITKLILLLFLSGAPLCILAQIPDWELKKDKKGVKVYTRSVEGSPLDEFKGIATIDAPLDRLLATLKDVPQYLDWIPDCARAELKEMEGEGHVHYMEMKAPFPVSNRDGYYRYTYIYEEETVRVEMESLADFGPENKGIVRIPYSKGYWLLEPVNSGQTRVTYQVHADPGGSIPAWLANAVVVDNPYQTFLNLFDMHE